MGATVSTSAALKRACAPDRTRNESSTLNGKKAAVVVFSHYPSDPRPRRAAEALLETGMEVEVISLLQEDGESLRDSVNGVSILRIPLKHSRGGKVGYVARYGAFILASFFLLAFRSLSRRYSLVHVHNMPDVLVFAALVPKLLGARVILDLHDPMPELMMTIFGLERKSLGVRVLQRLERWSIALADIVLTPNAAFEKLFVSRSCQADKLQVIMNSPDEKIFPYCEAARIGVAMAVPSNSFVIMYHGAIVERHGLDLAVLALEIVRREVPNAQLRIYGRPTPFLDQVMELARARGLQDAVQYLGQKSLPQIAAAIDECDVGIIPNRRSLFTELNLPTRIFEYLARGKAVIAPRTAGIQDYFSEDELMYFELGDAEDLARTLTHIVSNPQKANELVKRGQGVYRSHSWSEEQARFVTLALRLANDPRRGFRC